MGAPDGGSLLVDVNPATGRVTLKARQPLSIQTTQVELDPYEFVAVFGGALQCVGQSLMALQAQALRQIASGQPS